MKILVKTNCRNYVYMEGHATDIRTETEEKNGNKRQVLRFTLNHVNTNERKLVFVTPRHVILYNQSAISVSSWLKENMLIGVEGKLRTTKNNDDVIIAFHAERTDPITVNLEQNQVKPDETEDDND